MTSLTWKEFLVACDENPIGCVLLTSTGRKLLVGDINDLGGVCDDCRDEIAARRTEERIVAWARISPTLLENLLTEATR